MTPAKRKQGRPPWEPTKEERQLVKKLVIAGNSQEQVAQIIGKDVDTIAKHCREELDYKAVALANVAATLYQKALNGDTVSAIFIMKTQGRWSERHQLEHSGEVTINVSVGLKDGKK